MQIVLIDWTLSRWTIDAKRTLNPDYVIMTNIPNMEIVSDISITISIFGILVMIT